MLRSKKSEKDHTLLNQMESSDSAATIKMFFLICLRKTLSKKGFSGLESSRESLNIILKLFNEDGIFHFSCIRCQQAEDAGRETPAIYLLEKIQFIFFV